MSGSRVLCWWDSGKENIITLSAQTATTESVGGKHVKSELHSDFSTWKRGSSDGTYNLNKAREALEMLGKATISWVCTLCLALSKCPTYALSYWILRTVRGKDIMIFVFWMLVTSLATELSLALGGQEGNREIGLACVLYGGVSCLRWCLTRVPASNWGARGLFLCCCWVDMVGTLNLVQLLLFIWLIVLERGWWKFIRGPSRPLL